MEITWKISYHIINILIVKLSCELYPSFDSRAHSLLNVKEIYHILGSVEDGIVDVKCPTAIQAIFTNMTTQRYGESDKYSCSGTVFDVCTDKTMINITYSEPCDRENAETLSSE